MVLCQKRSVISILSFYLLELPPRIYHFSISLFFLLEFTYIFLNNGIIFQSLYLLILVTIDFLLP